MRRSAPSKGKSASSFKKRVGLVDRMNLRTSRRGGIRL